MKTTDKTKVDIKDVKVVDMSSIIRYSCIANDKLIQLEINTLLYKPLTKKEFIKLAIKECIKNKDKTEKKLIKSFCKLMLQNHNADLRTIKISSFSEERILFSCVCNKRIIVWDYTENISKEYYNIFLHSKKELEHIKIIKRIY